MRIAIQPTNTIHLLVPGLLVSLALTVGSGDAWAGIKCWKNKDGVRECGNVIPPEYAQQEHEVKSATGVTVKTQDRAKTTEEIITAREARKAAEQKQAEIDAAAKKQAAADKVLLDTFSSEDDMILARDGQITNLESQVKLTESHIAKLTRSRDQLISRAADLERRKKKIPPKLTKDIEGLRAQITDHEKFIQNKRAEQAALHVKFDMDVQRYRELRGTR
jgi:phage-related minor tail protein